MKDFAHLWNFWRKNLKEKILEVRSPIPKFGNRINFEFQDFLAAYLVKHTKLLHFFKQHDLNSISDWSIRSDSHSDWLMLEDVISDEIRNKCNKGYLPGVFNKWIHVILCVWDHIKHRRLLRNKEKMKPLKDAPGYYIINTEIK